MTGTEKQIKYAEDLRAKYLKILRSGLQGSTPFAREVIDDLVAAVSAHSDDARFWIDLRPEHTAVGIMRATIGEPGYLAIIRKHGLIPAETTATPVAAPVTAELRPAPRPWAPSVSSDDDTCRHGVLYSAKCADCED